MATPEEIIIAQNTKLNGYINDYRALAESYLADLASVASQGLALENPALAFGTTSTYKLADDPNVAANFNSGLAYPDADDIVQTALSGGYDSEFLEFLEQAARANKALVWVPFIEAIRQSYQTVTTSGASTFLSGLFPSNGNLGNTFSADMAAMTDDAALRHETDYALHFRTVLVDAANEYIVQAHAIGLNIEEIRAKVVQDMITIHSDYNRAVLAKAETDFRALVDTVANIHQQYALRVSQYDLAARQIFELAELEQRKELLALDTFMVEQEDAMRRAHMDFRLQFGKASALMHYASQSMVAAMLAKGVDSTGTLEQVG